MMWILWLMLTVQGHTGYTQLHSYPTETLCRDAQIYVLAEMRLAYPTDHTLRVFCKPQAV